MRTSLLALAVAGLGATPAAAQELVPPTVEHLAVIELEPDTDDGTVAARIDTGVEALVDVATDGRATLVETDADGELRRRLVDALSESRFSPATRDGEPIAARVRVRLRIVMRASADRSGGGRDGGDRDGGDRDGGDEARNDDAFARDEETAPLEEDDEDVFELGAVAEVSPVEGRVRLTLDEVRMVPGAFGEPMRVLDTLPGTVPLTNGLPYAFVRGAPPAGSAYSYDGIRLPGLFHLFGGPGYVHPTLIGPVTLHSGVPPARFGRLVGGALSGEGPDDGPNDGLIHGEAELRALDANAALRFPIGDDGSFTIAGRYGYPAPIVSALVPELDADYWDYQLRLDVAVDDRDRVQLVWLGVFDALQTSGFGDDASPESIELLFHRGELRFLRRLDDAEVGLALAFGHDDSSVNSDNFEVQGITVGPRLWLAAGNDDGLRIRAGAELMGRSGSVDAIVGEEADSETQLDNRAYVDAAGRSAAAAYASAQIPLSDRWQLEVALRTDVILTGSRIDASVDPRARLTWTARENLELYAAAGLAHQPAVFFLPVPGLDQIALDEGLQRVFQSELGGRVRLPFGVSLQLDGFVHAYDDLLLFELFGLSSCDGGQPIGSPIDCDDPEGIPRTDSIVWGAELLARYAIADRVFGWASYTLSWSDTESEAGVGFTPLFDVRHVANAVALVKITNGFRLGLRAHVRSGRRGAAIVGDPPRYHEERLPAFYRVDAMAAYGWTTSWGRLTATVEWFNTTLVREPVSLECDDSGDRCQVGYGPRLFYPNASIRAEF